MQSSSWSAYLAGKAIAISGAAIVAAMVLSRMALPMLVDSLSGMDKEPADWILIALQYSNGLPLLPVPGLVLGVAAMMLRPLRGVLAVLAMIASGLSAAIIVAMLMGTLAPFYDTSGGL
jgi:hypothetical protein